MSARSRAHPWFGARHIRPLTALLQARCESVGPHGWQCVLPQGHVGKLHCSRRGLREGNDFVEESKWGDPTMLRTDRAWHHAFLVVNPDIRYRVEPGSYEAADGCECRGLGRTHDNLSRFNCRDKPCPCACHTKGSYVPWQPPGGWPHGPATCSVCAGKGMVSFAKCPQCQGGGTV
jgi:hypothetical protein